MTNDKAREFFSAFHEGTLELGLRASLERRMSADADLRAEFATFVETVESLDGLRYEAIEIPAYLADRVAQRLSPALESRKIPFWRSLFAPRPAYGWAMGMAGALVIAAVGLRGLRISGTNMAGFVPTGSESVRWSLGNSGLVATFAGSNAHKVGVVAEGGVVEDYRLEAGQPLELTLSNPNAVARRFRIDVGDGSFATVAVPGTRPTARRAGSGSVAELASALANVYRVPVVVKGVPLDTMVRWSFDSGDARAAAEQGVDGHGSATMMDGNVLQIGR